MTQIINTLLFPKQTFQKLWQQDRGFITLLLLLFIEFLILKTETIINFIISNSNYFIGVMSLVSYFLQNFLSYFLILLCISIIWSFYLRYKNISYSILYIASIFSYCLIPHTLLIAIYTILIHYLPFLLSYNFLMNVIIFIPSFIFLTIACYTSLLGKEVLKNSTFQKHKRTYITSIITLIIIFSLAFGIRVQNIKKNWNSIRPPMIGDVLTDLSLTSLNKKSITHEDIKGQVILMDFWASWCGPCVDSIPRLKKLHKEFKDKGFNTISINNEFHNIDAIKKFAKKHTLNFPVYIDTNNILNNRFKILTLPTIFLFDRQSKIRYIHRGSTSMKTLKKEILKLINE